jgi:hypothetical protein
VDRSAGLEAGELVLPAALPAAFRGVVTRCLSPRARDRPTVKELQVWCRGAQLVASLSASGSHAAIPDAASRERPSNAVGDSSQQSPLHTGDGAVVSASSLSLGLVLLAILGALTLFVVGWAAIRS